MTITPLDVKNDLELIDHLGDDRRIVDAARCSHLGTGISDQKDQASEMEMGQSARDLKLIKYLYTNRHTSPFEHVKFTFRVSAPLFTIRQWMRHRTGSFNEISARYTKLNTRLYCPEYLRTQTTEGDKQQSGVTLETHFGIQSIKKVYQLAITEYEELLDRGIARELARIVLPVGIYSEFYWTVDLHNLLHFITLRSSDHAQWEIKQYSDRLLEIIRKIVPFAVEAFEENAKV